MVIAPLQDAAGIDCQVYLLCETTQWLVFASETDHPQVTARNRSQCRVAAVKGPGQPFCKYSVNNTHKIQEAACG